MENKIGPGTIFHYAKQNGFNFPPKCLYDERPPLNDIGNAERFAKTHRHLIRWCTPLKVWFCWDGKRWKPDSTETALALAMETARMLLVEAHECDDPDERLKILKWAQISAAANKLDAMLKLAKPALAITPDMLDQNTYLFNCLNGTVDLKTGELRAHNSEDFITTLAPVKYHRGKAAPRFMQFLNETFASNEALIKFVQRALGYCLSGDVSEQKLFLCHGGGQNGKSTLFNSVRELMGDYAQEAEPSLLVAKRNAGAATEDVARLKGIRLATTIETNDYMKLDEARLKSLTGGDKVTARPLYGHIFEFQPTHKLFIVTNHLPPIANQSVAIWRRLKLIPFNQQVPDSSKDKDLPEKLKSEDEGILAWLVEGCLDWQKEGLPDTPAVSEATADYKAESDTIAKFLSDCCEKRATGRVQTSLLYHHYRQWCQSNGEQELSIQAFSKKMKEKTYKQKATKQCNAWEGLVLAED